MTEISQTDDKLKKLTPPQEVFCVSVAEGKSYIDAYIAAYPHAVKWKRPSAHNKGSALAKRGEIEARITELKSSLAKKIEKKFVWTRQHSIETLALIARKGEKEAARVSAIKELNTMLGYHAPQKMDLTSSDGTMASRPALNVKKLPDNILKALLEARDAMPAEPVA